jgi:hypothetical protein
MVQPDIFNDSFCRLVLSVQLHLALVNSFDHLLALDHRWFGELLPITQLPDNTHLFKFALELLECPLNVFAFFYRNNNHIDTYLSEMVITSFDFEAAKIQQSANKTNIFTKTPQSLPVYPPVMRWCAAC